MPAGQVIGLVPGGLAVGYAGNVEIEVTTGATVHFEDTTPLAIGTPGTPPTVAAPTHSAFQEDLLIVKARGRCAWTVQPGAVAVINGAAW